MFFCIQLKIKIVSTQLGSVGYASVRGDRPVNHLSLPTMGMHTMLEIVLIDVVGATAGGADPRGSIKALFQGLIDLSLCVLLEVYVLVRKSLNWLANDY